MPLRLIVKVDEDLLEGHLLANEGPSCTCDKWTEVMSIHANVLRVGGGFGLAATWPHKALKSVELRLGVCLKLWVK